MFLIKYLNAAYNKKIFYLNNYGDHIRDFTYINDVTNLIIELRKKKIEGSDIYNICSNKPIHLKKIIKLLTPDTPVVKIKKLGFQKAASKSMEPYHGAAISWKRPGQFSDACDLCRPSASTLRLCKVACARRVASSSKDASLGD